MIHTLKQMHNQSFHRPPYNMSHYRYSMEFIRRSLRLTSSFGIFSYRHKALSPCSWSTCVDNIAFHATPLQCGSPSQAISSSKMLPHLLYILAKELPTRTSKDKPRILAWKCDELSTSKVISSVVVYKTIYKTINKGSFFLCCMQAVSKMFVVQLQM